MEFTAGQIAQLLGGEIKGDPETKVNTLSKIEEGKKGTLAFLSNPKYNEYLYTTEASIVIVNRSLELEKEVSSTLILVEDARQSFAKLLEIYAGLKHPSPKTEQPSFIDESAVLGADCYIGAFVYISKNVKVGNNVKIYPNSFIGQNAVIGNDCIIYAGVKIYDDSKIGNNCTLHSGVIIGGDGFGFVPNSENNYQKVPHIGNVILEDHVEIGSNTAIDRGTVGSTIIRKGVKLDNLIQIAHNVEIGENTVIAAQTGIAGSTKIGKNCMIGGQVGIVGHLTIADNVKIAAQSGIGSSIKNEGEILQGSPAFAIGDYKRSYVLFRSLPALQEKLNKLIQEIKNHKQES